MVLDSSVCFWSVHCSADFLQFGGGGGDKMPEI